MNKKSLEKLLFAPVPEKKYKVGEVTPNHIAKCLKRIEKLENLANEKKNPIDSGERIWLTYYKNFILYLTDQNLLLEVYIQLNRVEYEINAQNCISNCLEILKEQN